MFPFFQNPKIINLHQSPFFFFDGCCTACVWLKNKHEQMMIHCNGLPRR